MEENEIVKKYGAGNYAKFVKLFMGSAQGVSKKGNNFCFCEFLEINRFGSGKILTLSCRNDELPSMCDSLKCGDQVEILVDMSSLSDKPILVDILRKTADSKLI